MPTAKELYSRATELNIDGRSSMSKGELEKAIAKAEKKAAKDAAPASEPAPAEKPKKAKAEKKAPAPLAFMPEIRPGHQGPHVLVAQGLLKQHGYQLGAHDGIAGRETVRAVQAFRADRKLKPGDRIDGSVWAALAAS